MHDAAVYQKIHLFAKRDHTKNKTAAYSTNIWTSRFLPISVKNKKIST